MLLIFPPSSFGGSRKTLKQEDVSLGEAADGLFVQSLPESLCLASYVPLKHHTPEFLLTSDLTGSLTISPHTTWK